MAWAPGTSVLWTAVNERDGLGTLMVAHNVSNTVWRVAANK